MEENFYEQIHLFLDAPSDSPTMKLTMPNNAANVSNLQAVNTENVHTWTPMTQIHPSFPEHVIARKDTPDLCVTSYSASKKTV